MSRYLNALSGPRDYVERINYLVNTTDTLTSNFLSVANFGAIGDGVVDNTTAIQNCFNLAPDNATIIFPYGHYKHSGNIAVTGKSLHIIAYGATIECTQDVPAFVFTATLDTIQSASVSSNTVTVTSTTGFSIGDVVKVICDDRYSGTRSASGGSDYRYGEHVSVDTIVSSTQFTSSQPLRDGYWTTNVRAVKINYATATISGGSWNYETGHKSTWSEKYFRFYGYQNVVIDGISVDYGYGASINFRGCINYKVVNSYFKNLSDPVVTGHYSAAYGYAIEDTSCTGGIVSKCHFQNLRHGFTTNPYAITAGTTDIWYYGPSIYWAVSDCTGFATTSTPFDSHHGGEYGQFINCTASNSPLGLQLRGRHLRAIGCRTYNCAYGVQPFSEGSSVIGSSDRSMDIEFIDCEFSNSAGSFSRVARIANVIDVRFKRCRFIDNYAYQTVYETETPSVIFDNCYFYVRGAVSTGRALDFTSTTNLQFNDCEFDLDSTNTSRHFVQYSVSGGTIKFKKPNITTTSAFSHFIYESTLAVTAWVIDGETNSTTLDFIYVPSGTEYQSYRRTDGTYSGGIYTSVTTASQNLTFNNSIDDHIYCRLLPDATYTLGTLAAGLKQGQVLNIYISGAGAYTLALKHGSTYRTWLTNKKDLTLRDGDGVSLIWQGTSWIMGSTIKQEVYNATSTQLNSLTDAINTQDKFTGKMVYNTTVATPVFSTGATAGSTWVDGAGTLVNTPV